MIFSLGLRAQRVLFVLLGLIFITAESLYFLANYKLQSTSSVKEGHIRQGRPTNVSIPFYFYVDPPFRALEECCRQNSPNGFEEIDFIFNEQLKYHRWRVMDPEKALLFVVPIPWNRMGHKVCCEGKTDLLNSVFDNLEASTWRSRHGGNDHLSVADYWKPNTWRLRDKQRNKRLNAIIRNMITTENSFVPGSLCRFLAPYQVGQSRPKTDKLDSESKINSNSNSVEKIITKNETAVTDTSHSDLAYCRNAVAGRSKEDFSGILAVARKYIQSRKYTFGFAGQAGNRHGYALRKIALAKLPGFMSPNILVHTLGRSKGGLSRPCSSDNFEGCAVNWSANNPAVQKASRESKFCLFFRGDTWDSRRLFDCIAGGTIPLIISDGMVDAGLPLQCEVDWELLSVQIPQAEFRRDPRGALSKYMPKFDTEEDLINLGLRILEVRRAQPIVLYNHPESVTSEMMIKEAVRKCFPEAAIKEFVENQKRNGHTVSVSSLRDLPCEYQDYSKVAAEWTKELNGRSKYFE